MSNIFHVLFYSMIGGVFSLIGGFLLLSNKKKADLLSTYATPFAAGALLAAAFLDLLPESSHQGDIEKALGFTLFGILGSFLLERFLRVFHHHHDHGDDVHQNDAPASLIVAGDTIHNFIDGIAIAAGFLIDVKTGVVVTLAVAAHEIPQEIGDFGLLLKKGLSRRKVLQVNLLSAMASVFSAVLFFKIGESVDLPIDIILGLVAGMFIYIAVSDIIPSIHRHEDKVIAGPQTLLLIIGAISVGFISSILHQYIDQDDHDGHNHGRTELISNLTKGE